MPSNFPGCDGMIRTAQKISGYGEGCRLGLQQDSEQAYRSGTGAGAGEHEPRSSGRGHCQCTTAQNLKPWG